jgi:hypothetical protein
MYGASSTAQNMNLTRIGTKILATLVSLVHDQVLYDATARFCSGFG